MHFLVEECYTLLCFIVCSLALFKNNYLLLFFQGLELEDAMAFWESHFSRLVSHDQFIKNYSYNFRHMYGKEGARKNFTPYSCMKIIMGAPPETGAHHGCPYRY